MNASSKHNRNNEESFAISTLLSRRPLVENRDEETSETTATDSTNTSGFITMYAAKRLKLLKQEDEGDNNGINSRAMRESRRTHKVNEQIEKLRMLLQDADYPLPQTASKYHVLQSCEKYIQQMTMKSNEMDTIIQPRVFGTSTALSNNLGCLSRELVSSSTIGITNAYKTSAKNSNSILCLNRPSHQRCKDHYDQSSKKVYVDDSMNNNNLNYNDLHDNKCNINPNINCNTSENTAIMPTTTTTTNTVDIITALSNSINNGPIDYEHVLETSDLPIAVASADGQLLRANRLFFTMTGYEPQDIGTMTLFSMAIPAYRKQLFEAVGASLVAVLSSKKVSDHPLVVLIQSKTGHPLHMNISAVPQSRHDVNAFLYAPKNILCCAILPEFRESVE